MPYRDNTEARTRPVGPPPATRTGVSSLCDITKLLCGCARMRLPYPTNLIDVNIYLDGRHIIAIGCGHARNHHTDDGSSGCGRPRRGEAMTSLLARRAA